MARRIPALVNALRLPVSVAIKPPLPASIVNPNTNTVVVYVKTERVGAFDRLKRRDVKDLCRVQLILGADGPQIRVIAQVTVAVAIGVRHLGDNRDQPTIHIPAKPKANRIEHMSQHPWLRQKLNPINAGDLMFR